MTPTSPSAGTSGALKVDRVILPETLCREEAAAGSACQQLGGNRSYSDVKVIFFVRRSPHTLAV